VYSFNHNSDSFVSNFWITFILKPTFSFYPEKRSSRFIRWTARTGFPKGTNFMSACYCIDIQSIAEKILLFLAYFFCRFIVLLLLRIAFRFRSCFQTYMRKWIHESGYIVSLRVWKPSRGMENTFVKSIVGTKRVRFSYREGTERKVSLLLQEM